ncbi:hypothetical protein EV363DRAFT_1146849, partial [Boletus edulis]
AEEYGPHCILHSIPCGTMPLPCRSTCRHKIIEKTLPHLKPACPFCHEQFTSDDVRLIHIDFFASGYATPLARQRAPRFPIVEPSF